MCEHIMRSLTSNLKRRGRKMLFSFECQMDIVIVLGSGTLLLGYGFNLWNRRDYFHKQYSIKLMETITLIWITFEITTVIVRIWRVVSVILVNINKHSINNKISNTQLRFNDSRTYELQTLQNFELFDERFGIQLN